MNMWESENCIIGNDLELLGKSVNATPHIPRAKR